MAERMSRRTAVTVGAAGLGTLAGAAAGSANAAQPLSPQIFNIAHMTIPIVGDTAVFPVRRVYCIGRNYAAHAREMGSDPNREPPFFFQKPADAVVVVQPGSTGTIAYPTLTKNFHYEIELVAFLKAGGRNIPVEKALDLVLGYSVGLDMTRRDLQERMKAEQKPWEIGKSFDQSAPMGPIHLAEKTGHLAKGRIALSVNGAVKQNSDLSNMIWNVAEQIAQLSRANELYAGDIIFSGTPENVGPVVAGDTMVGMIAGLPDLTVKVADPAPV
jgi:2-keto-4-pentenoate hydratase/2-oxohepta-3-ene-1,7-dioic acid hydratase in catechol pathway